MRSPTRHRVLALVVALPLTAVILTACAGGSGSGATTAASPHDGTLTIARAAASNGWEGDKCVDTSIELNPAVYDTLLRAEVPTGDGLAPGLAEKYEWDAAATSYVFHLRKNAAFSNGDPVTAKDVVFSVQQWTTGEFSKSYYANVDHAVAVDDHTVRIVMKKVDTFLPALLTWCTSTVYPADFAGMAREAFFKKPIGAGPYEVESWDQPMGTSEKITLAPNPHFYGWKGKPPLKKIVVETITDPNQRALQYQSKNVDILEAVDSATATQIPKAELTTTKPNPIQSLILNVKTPGLSNPKVREAMALAIDRSALAKTVGIGAVPAVGALPVNVPGAVEPTRAYSYDVSRAKELLKESGETALSFTLLYDASDNSTDVMAQTVQQQLAAVGITLKLQTTDGNTVTSRQADGDYQISFGGASAISPTIFDPISWIAIQYGWTGTSASTIQDEFLAGTSTLDKAEQKKHALAVQDFITTENGMIGLINTASTYGSQPWVKGFTPLQYGFFYFDSLSD